MTLLVLLVLAAGLSLVAAWACAEPGRQRVVLVGGVVLASALWLVACVFGARGPIDDLYVLHEGGSACTLRSMFGVDAHAGALWSEALHKLADGDAPPLVWLRRVNHVCAGLALIGVAAVAGVATRSLLGIGVVFWMLWLSRSYQTGQISETPAPVLWFAVVAAAPGWKLLDEAPRRPRGHHILAALSLAACTGVAVGVRTEFALPGVVVVGLALAVFWSGPEAVDRADVRCRAVLRALAIAPLEVRSAMLLAVLALPRIAERASFHTRVMVAAALPTPDFVGVPLAVASTTPFLVLALAVVGVAVGLAGRAPRSLAALTTIQLLMVYLVASHGVGWEMLRYTTLAAALLWLHALAGWVAIERYATRAGWHPAWRSTVGLLVVALSIGAWNTNPSHPGWWNANARNQGLVVRQSKQREGAAILRALRDNPACTMVARVRRDGSRDAPMVLATFGWRRPLRFAAFPGATPRDLQVLHEPCVLYFRTLDCNREASALCDADVVGAAPERVIRERFAIYSDPQEYGLLAPEVTYGIWRYRREGLSVAH